MVESFSLFMFRQGNTGNTDVLNQGDYCINTDNNKQTTRERLRLGTGRSEKVDSLFQNLARRPCVLAEANLAHVLSLNLKKSHLDEKRPSARHSRFE